MNRSLMERLKANAIWIVLGAAVLALAGLLTVMALSDPRSAAPEPTSTLDVGSTATVASPTTPPDTPTAEPSLAAAPLAASVNGFTITQSYLSQTVRLNKVLGQLSGASILDEEETLRRLIMSQLILQGATTLEEQSREDVEKYIASLEQNWQVSDETVVQRLQEVGLDRPFFEDTIRRLLTVQAGVEALENEGHDIAEWLEEQELDANIMMFEDAANAERAEAAPTAQATLETEQPTPAPRLEAEVPDVAPDFTLDQAGGGSFTLADQLQEGPVVLVFFEKCG